MNEVVDVGVRDHDPLGRASRSRGIEQSSKSIWGEGGGQGGCQRGRRRSFLEVLIINKLHWPLHCLKISLQVLVPEQNTRVSIISSSDDWNVNFVFKSGVVEKKVGQQRQIVLLIVL